MFLFVFLLNLFTVYIPLVLIGYFMPNFIKKTLLFGVVIPEDVSDWEEVVALRKVYKRNYGISALLISFLLNIATFKTENIDYSNWGIFILIGVMSINYLYAHNKAKKLKKDKGWTANKKQMVIVDTSHRYQDKFPAVHWFWLPISIFIFTLFFTMIQYPHLSDQIPTRFDFSGQPMGYSDKSFRAAFGLPLIQAGMTSLFFFIYWTIKRVRPSISAARPKTSSLQNKIAKRYWMIYLLVTLVAMNLQFGLIQLNVLQIIRPSLIGNLLAHGLGIGIPLVGVIFVAVKTGQSGNRIKVETEEGINNTVIDREDDNLWKWGMFYYNPEDPSLFIEKRFGIGWTINCAHPGGKVIIVITLLAILAGVLSPWIFSRS
ncbi:Uncharacterized membrane protein [Anaerovirgula multivorans]|uniref:Uncharacterized membrane protein n=1 Tax=Anaerovirgula multivorans TaxID=312168 RepID=A0A239ALY5_9FIRM|nr:DUF5808 domain-containing protein [Anaerovirgula multivorans]SNR96667.1 Uncharacterized membrane protein [Anaerovirgula multivorans]